MTLTRRPLIGLPLGRDLPDRPAYLRIRQTYPRAVEQAGGVPVLIPPTSESGHLDRLLEVLDGLVFPGGRDVSPTHYGEARHITTKVDDVLDGLELELARWALERETPVLGICRGQQLLNVALGGKLVQDLPSQRPGSLPHTQEPREPRTELSHSIELEAGCRLAGIFGAQTFEVNSFHHQAIEKLGRGLRPVGWAPDGVVEALESTEHPWLLTVQFHPEDLVGFHEPSQRLFRAFVQAAAGQRGSTTSNGASSAVSPARRV